MKKLFTSSAFLVITILITHNMCLAQNVFPSSGNVGIGTTSPNAKLNILDNGVSINANSQFNGGLIIQSNTGGRNQTVGAQLEFVIPANADGSNPWAQGRIITVAGNEGSGNATGKMIFGTRRWFQKPGTAGYSWYYGDDLTIDGTGNVAIGTGGKTFFSNYGVGAANGNAYSLEIGGPNPTSNSAQATLFFHHHGIAAHQLRYNSGSLFLEAAGNGYGTNPYPNFFVGGNVGIGTTTPGSYKLAVAGKIAATGEVRVFTDGTVSFPDYVFDPAYQLPSLEETEKYVKENHHLPEVPSAAEIEKDGMSLNEMNVILLKKVEELTLYMIEMKKENEALKARVSKLEER